MFEVKLRTVIEHNFGNKSYGKYHYSVGTADIHFEQDLDTGAVYDIFVVDDKICSPFYLTVNTTNYIPVRSIKMPISYPNSVDIQMNYNTEGTAAACITRLNYLLEDLTYLKELSESIMSIFENGIHRDVLEKYKKELNGNGD